MAVSLQKGQKISLDKEAGVKLTKIIMGLGWDGVKETLHNPVRRMLGVSCP